MRIASGVLLTVLLVLVGLGDVSGQGKCSETQLQSLKKGGLSDKRIAEICGGSPTRQGNGGPAAVEALRTLAASGNAEASFELGRRYEAGEGVIKDYVEAYVWYSRAYSVSGRVNHKAALDALERRMQPADIALAQQRARSVAGNDQKPSPTPKPEPRVRTGPPPGCDENALKACIEKSFRDFEGCGNKVLKETDSCEDRASSASDRCHNRCRQNRGAARDRCYGECEKANEAASASCEQQHKRAMDSCDAGTKNACAVLERQCSSR